MSIEEQVKNYLSTEGCRYQDVGDDETITFKYQGLGYFLSVDKNDSEFCRLFMPQIYQLEGNRTKVLEAINTLTSETKAIKAFLVEDQLWLSIEMILPHDASVCEVLERCLDILSGGRNRIARLIFE